MDKKIVYGIAAGLIIALAFDNITSKIFVHPNADNLKTVKVEQNKNTNSSSESISNVSSQNTSISSGATVHSIDPKSIKIDNNKDTISFIANINGKEQQIKFDTSLIDIEDGDKSNNYTYQITQDNNGNYTNTVILPSNITAQIN